MGLFNKKTLSKQEEIEYLKQKKREIEELDLSEEELENFTAGFPKQNALEDLGFESSGLAERFNDFDQRVNKSSIESARMILKETEEQEKNR